MAPRASQTMGSLDLVFFLDQWLSLMLSSVLIQRTLGKSFFITTVIGHYLNALGKRGKGRQLSLQLPQRNSKSASSQTIRHALFRCQCFMCCTGGTLGIGLSVTSSETTVSWQFCSKAVCVACFCSSSVFCFLAASLILCSSDDWSLNNWGIVKVRERGVPWNVTPKQTTQLTNQ